MRKSLILAAAAATAAFAVALATGSPPAAGAADGPLQGGSLDWGVKSSFRAYITGAIALGSVSPGGGAAANGDGTFRFPLTGGTSSGSTVQAAFGGEVHFSGHLGALDLRITDPRVTIDGATGTLVVDAASKGLETGMVETFDDVVLATLDLSSVTPTGNGAAQVYAAVSAVLTADGARAFAGFYKAGDALDPVTVTVRPSGGSSTPTTTKAATPTTAAPSKDAVGCTPTIAVAGQAIRYCGSGFAPREQVQVLVHSTAPQQLSVATADARGEVPDATITLPATLPAGDHKLELRGITTGRSIFSPAFTVTAAGAPAAAATAVSATLAETGWGSIALGVLAAFLLAFGLVLSRLTRV
jgi:hypothetical protein